MKLLATFAAFMVSVPSVCIYAATGAPSVAPRSIAVQTVPVQEEMRWRGWVPSGQVVEINNVNGNVRAEETSGDQIEVIALKRGSADPDGVSIEVVEHKGGVTICAVYPNANAGHPFECRPSHGGGFRIASTSDSEAHIRWENGGGGDVLLNDLRVDFLVLVPKGLRFIGRTVDGEISTHLFDQDVEVHNVRGNVSFEMNPANGAEVRAETAMGQMDSEFPLSIRCDRNRGMSASGHFGHAHRRLVRLKTDSGNIRLQRATL
jgi:DUF4097 and DUF4098 domain-containing protein YvlB